MEYLFSMFDYKNFTTSRFTSKVYFPLELIIITWKFDRIISFLSFFIKTFAMQLWFLPTEYSVLRWFQNITFAWYTCQVLQTPRHINEWTIFVQYVSWENHIRAISLIMQPLSYASACYARINFVSYFHWNWRNSTNTRISLSHSYNEYFDPCVHSIVKWCVK